MSSLNRIELMLSVSPAELLEVRLAKESLAKDPAHPKNNWVTQQGGLPQAITHMAKDIMEEKGVPKDHAIAIAVSQCKKLAAKGDPKYVKALAQWESMKAGAHASPNK
jgi:hypothetical protein